MQIHALFFAVPKPVEKNFSRHMSVTAPCVSCLIVAALFALIYAGFRQAAHAASRSGQSSDKPGRSVLLLAWGLLFIVNVGTALRTQADVWPITDDGNEASVRMGLLEEPRYVLNAVCNHFVEMPENTIREQTFCCGAGSGLNTEEIMELRMRSGMPRGNALRYVQEKYGVNHMACVCAIDRATLPPLANYWAPGVNVSGLHELVGNALVMTGESKRTMDLRQEDLPNVAEDDEALQAQGEGQ